MSQRRRRAQAQRTRRRQVAVAAGGVVAVLAVAGVVWFPSPEHGPEPVQVRMVDTEFVPSEIDAVAGQVVQVRNDGKVVHSLLVTGMGKGVELQPGTESEFRIPGDAEGTYRLVCDIPGHAEAGMVGTLDVTAS